MISRLSMSLILLLILLAKQGRSLSFEFRQENMNQIFLEGDAFLNSERSIELTETRLNHNANYSYGRASYLDPIQLWDPDSGRVTDFTTHFTFSIRQITNGMTGDGITFFLAPFNSPIANNSDGGNLGLISRPDQATDDPGRSFVAVEFDTFKNGFDPSRQHVGIDINSVISVVNVSLTNGSMDDGTVASSWVVYDSASLNLSVFLTYDQNPVFSEEYLILRHPVILSEYLPEKIRVGFTAATGLHTEIHTLHSWSFNSTLELNGNKTSIGARLAIGLGVAFAILIILVLGIFWFFCLRKRVVGERDVEEYDSSIDGEFERGAGPKRFTYNELRLATRDFSDEGKLGEGGFGGVYKGLLGGTIGEVAVKRISKASKQGQKEYVSEVKIISRLRHRNLVQLIGWCHKQREFLLVYEYLPNGSLDSHLFGRKVTTPLPWATRHKIGLGLASALLYLHEDWEQCVVHRDIKSSNIMLDANFNAKLGDFGLARLVDHEYSLHTVAFAGTMGYIAPECVDTGKSSKESDVYSFGVVALEICCGRRSIIANADEPSKVKLVNWVWEIYGKGQLVEAVDKRLNMEFDPKEVECWMTVGLWCCHPDPNFRPTMRQVMSVLNFEAPLPNNLPKELPRPMYCLTLLSISIDSYSSSAIAGISTQSSTSNNESSSKQGSSKPLLELADC